MPEILAALLPAAADVGLSAAGEAALGAGADLGVDAALGSAAGLAGAGLPFAAGAGEVGSVASGAGTGGVQSLLDFALGGGAATGLPMGGELAAAGLPFAAGAGEIGSSVGSTGVDLGALLAGTGGADGGTLPGGSTPTSGGPMSLGGVSSFGGIPSDIGSASFSSAPAVPGASAVMAANPAGVSVPGVLDGASAAGAASAAAPAGTGPLDLTSLLKYAAPALGAAGLGYSLYKGQQPTASTDRITGQDMAVKQKAGEIMGQGQGLASHVESGTLPPALQQQLDTQIKDAKTKMISTYAANGMNTDPKKNSMLQQELNAIDKQGLALKGDMEKQLLASGATLINSGTALVGADNDLIKTLSNIDQNQQKMIGSAIANFAAALSGKSNSGLTVNLGGEKKAA